MRFRSLISILLFLLGLVLILFLTVRTNPYLFAAWGLLMLAALYMIGECIVYLCRTSRLRREGKTLLAEITRVHYGPDFHFGSGLGLKQLSTSDVWAMQTVSFQLVDEEGHTYSTPLLVFTGSRTFRVSLGSGKGPEISIRKRAGKKALVFVNPNNRDDYFVDPHTL